MGWVAEDGRHEGYAVAVLADGRDATAEDNPVSGNTAWWCFDGQDGRPPAVGVRAGCDCYAANSSRVVRTWRGSTVHPIVFSDQEATEGLARQNGPYAEWENIHVPPADDAAAPGNVTALLAEVRERLTALAEQRPLAALTAVARLEATAGAAGISAAAAAQQRGSSWTDIGKAVGITSRPPTSVSPATSGMRPTRRRRTRPRNGWTAWRWTQTSPCCASPIRRPTAPTRGTPSSRSRPDEADRVRPAAPHGGQRGAVVRTGAAC